MARIKNQCGKVFTIKTYGSELYKWSPLCSQNSPNENKRQLNQLNKRNVKPFYCSAISGSQGQDWITSYVYNLEVVNSQQVHLAYVECDYVE